MDNGWQRVSVSYTPTAGGTYTVGVRMQNCAGYAFADDFQLEEGDAASSLNLLQNGAFDIGSSGVDWIINANCAVVSLDAGETKGGTGGPGTNAVRLSGNVGEQRRVSQNVTVNAPAGSTFLVSGWAKANAAPSFNSDTTNPAATERFFGLCITITYADSTSEKQYIPCCTDTSNWQYVTGTIVPKEANMSKAIAAVQVAPAYDNNLPGFAYFDNLSLRMEPVQTY